MFSHQSRQKKKRFRFSENLLISLFKHVDHIRLADNSQSMFRMTPLAALLLLRAGKTIPVHVVENLQQQQCNDGKKYPQSPASGHLLSHTKFILSLSITAAMRTVFSLSAPVRHTRHASPPNGTIFYATIVVNTFQLLYPIVCRLQVPKSTSSGVRFRDRMNPPGVAAPP